MTLERLDHIAIEVPNLDEWITILEGTCSMRLLRTGSRHLTGQRIALLGDGTGMKLELIEGQASGPAFVHLAFRVDDTDAVHAAMVEDGWQSVRSPHPLALAHARTALVSDGRGFELQLIQYDPSSQDISEWDSTDRQDTTASVGTRRREA